MRFRVYRVLILFVLLLLLVQLAIPSVLAHLERTSSYASTLENNYRFGSSVDKTAFEAFIYHISFTKGYKIVFIGDSVIAGATVNDPKHTIPSYFQQLAAAKYPGKGIHVYNLGIPANRPSDIYFIYKMLQETGAANLIIMNVNYAFYSDEMLRESLIARPDLFTSVMDGAEAQELGLKYSPVETGLKHELIEKWNLYSKREELSFFLFGKNPREILTQIGKSKRKLPETAKEYDKDFQNWKASEPFPKDKIKHWEQVFNVSDLGSNNKGYWFLERTLQKQKNEKAALAAFFTPVNGGMVQKFDLMKYGSTYNSNMIKISEFIKGAGIPLFDYTNSVNPDYFHDLFHMNAYGNEQTAKLLLNDLNNLLSKELYH